MNINYRQILIIVGCLFFLELLSFGLKKYSGTVSNNEEQKSLFPLPLNEDTKQWLFGDWKYESYHFAKDSVLVYTIRHLIIHEDGTYNQGVTITPVPRSEDSNNKEAPFSYYFTKKWEIENGNLVKNGYKDLVIFYNEDEFSLFTKEGIHKYSRITKTKHQYNITNETK